MPVSHAEWLAAEEDVTLVLSNQVGYLSGPSGRQDVHKSAMDDAILAEWSFVTEAKKRLLSGEKSSPVPVRFW